MTPSISNAKRSPNAPFAKQGPSLFRATGIVGMVLSLSLCFAASADGQDLVLNDGFQMEDTSRWTEYGTIPLYSRGVVKFDVTGNGVYSFAYYQHPGDGVNGGLEQSVHLVAGETYEVRADICYHNG